MTVSAGSISAALGIAYTIAWSVSFYPQVLLNYRRKSVEGLSIDFCTLNPIGFACYLIYNCGLYASPVIRKEYASRHEGHLPQVVWNDILFAAHVRVCIKYNLAYLMGERQALAISSFTLLQTFIYKGTTTQRISIFNAALITMLFLAAISLAIVTATSRIGGWLDVMYFFSYVKLYISFAKYLPQAWLNYQRKSTVGWSIENILLDLTGGTLSLAQLVLDSARSDDWSGITGNVGKLGLSFLSITFDVVFIVQHFVLYRHSRQDSQGGDESDRANERQRLLS